MKYKGQNQYKHKELPAVGILIANLGTPAKPDAPGVRKYLAEFLSDPRVVELPRLLWWLVLHGVILRLRPKRAARAYRKIWTPEGSPLLKISRQQVSALDNLFKTRSAAPVKVVLGMRYGEPSISAALDELTTSNIEKLLVLPLYPQYSGTTTASTFDAVSDALKKWRYVPEIRFVNHYHDFQGYITTLANSLSRYWEENGEPERLLFSFHGLPKRNLLAGDPYFCECQKTARLVAEKLQLDDSRWQTTFQSRFGREEWLKPYTDHLLTEWGSSGVKRVDVICPGFSADCLETLEEIAQENRQRFLEAGGAVFNYIPALNDRPEHMTALASLVIRHLQGWPEASGDWDAESRNAEAARRLERARSMGAPDS